MVAARTHHSATPTATNAASVVKANRGTRVRLAGLLMMLRESALTGLGLMREEDQRHRRMRLPWPRASDLLPRALAPT